MSRRVLNQNPALVKRLDILQVPEDSLCIDTENHHSVAGHNSSSPSEFQKKMQKRHSPDFLSKEYNISNYEFDDSTSSLECSRLSVETVEDDTDYLQLKIYSSGFPKTPEEPQKEPRLREDTTPETTTESQFLNTRPVPSTGLYHFAARPTADPGFQAPRRDALEGTQLPMLWRAHWPDCDVSSSWYDTRPTDTRSWQPEFPDRDECQRDVTTALCEVFALTPEDAACWVNLIGLRSWQWYDRVAQFTSKERVLDLQKITPSQQIRIVIEWIWAIGSLKAEHGTAGDLKIMDVLDRCYLRSILTHSSVTMESYLVSDLNSVIVGLQILDIWGILHPLTPTSYWMHYNLPIDLLQERHTNYPTSTATTILATGADKIFNLTISSLAIAYDSRNLDVMIRANEKTFVSTGLDIGSLTELGRFKIVMTPYAADHLLVRRPPASGRVKSPDGTQFELLVYWFPPLESVLNGVTQSFNSKRVYGVKNISSEIRQTIRMLFAYKCANTISVPNLMHCLIAFNAIDIPEWLCCKPHPERTAAEAAKMRRIERLEEPKVSSCLGDVVSWAGCTRFDELRAHGNFSTPTEQYILFPVYGGRLRILRY